MSPCSICPESERVVKNVEKVKKEEGDGMEVYVDQGMKLQSGNTGPRIDRAKLCLVRLITNALSKEGEVTARS